jgi:caffeoyl-CoA O-methyltransferase
MLPENILDYCRSHTTSEPDMLQRLTRETHLTQLYPRMLTGHMQGTLLRMISTMMRPTHILEIGTFTGYSALCLATGGGVLHTIEVDPEQEEIIRKYLAEAGLKDAVHLHIGDALQIIPMLDYSWDLVYIDADKPNYLNYYKMVLPKVRQGGFIIADNALWDGKVLEPETADKDTLGIMEFNDYVQEDSRVENLLLPFRDGLMIVRKY